jgi:hypothetical protein
MKPLWRAAVAILLVAGLLLGVWVYQNRDRFTSQWASYQVGAAERYPEARQRLVALQQSDDDRDVRLREVAAKWGTGNRRFDLHLARFITDPASNPQLRELFSRHLSHRPELLARWGHFWAHQASLPPDEQISQIVTYLDQIAYAEDAIVDQPLSWREVLDLQAVFTLTGARDRAIGLTPENWRDHFRVWQETAPVQHPTVQRPSDPLPPPAPG